MLIGWARLHEVGFQLQTDEKEFRNALLLSLIQTFDLNVKENQHATTRSLLVGKQKDFSIQKCIDLYPEKRLSWKGWCRTKHRGTELYGCQLEVSFFIFLSDRLYIGITGHLIDMKIKTAQILLVR